MQYIYMNNYRGFNKTLLPICKNTFLVGENSTGKSSFLKLLYVISRPLFWFTPDSILQSEGELGGFNDIVSAWSTDQTYFQVGMLLYNAKTKKKPMDYYFAVHTFSNKEGIPSLSRYIQFKDGKITKIVLNKNRTKYKVVDKKTNKINTENDATKFLLKVLDEDKSDTRGFKMIPPKTLPLNAPFLVTVSVIQRLASKEKNTESDFLEVPFALDLVWIAPIRTKPQRYYDGLKQGFSPEGDHAPFVLRRSLRLRAHSVEFVKKLKKFGKTSGLFETISTHSFDKSPQTPFELLVKFAGAELNINNVGYGVSQVLPLIVEFLSNEKNGFFAVQQPEVHLHPRAQAALGDLLYELSKERNHSFIMETHSEYLIDRFRLRMNQDKKTLDAQVIFFERVKDGNCAHILSINPNGQYPMTQPPSFRDFFVNEEIDLLEI